MNRTIYVVAIVALVAACSGDAAGNNGNNGTNNGDDNANNGTNNGANNANNGNNSNNGNNGGSDMGMDAGTDMSAGDTGSDASADAADMYFPDVTQQMCAYPSDDPMCPGGTHGPGTFLDSIHVVTDKSCCKDFTGDGNIDNKVGEYVTIIAAQGTDLNANIETAIETGRLVYLFEYADWDNETYDPDPIVTTLLGTDTDVDFTDNLAGTGEFWVEQESYDPNGDPKWVFASAEVRNGVLTAADGQLQLFFPGLLDEVQLRLEQVAIEADVVSGADFAAHGTVELENGEMSGILDRDRFYTSLNEAAQNCACLQKEVFAYEPANDQYTCEAVPQDETNCQNSPSAGCQYLAHNGNCTFLAALSRDADVDTDGDGNEDGYSFGATFTGVGASIVDMN